MNRVFDILYAGGTAATQPFERGHITPREWDLQSIEELVTERVASMFTKLREESRIVLASADPRKPPPYIQELLAARQRALLLSAQNGQQHTNLAVDLTVSEKITDPETGRMLRPNILTYLSRGRQGVVFDLDIIRYLWAAPFALSMPGALDLCLVPCPNQILGHAKHLTVKTGCCFRSFIGSAGLSSPALVAERRCSSCGCKFRDADANVLSQLPADITALLAIDPDSNGGDPEFIIGTRQGDSARANSIHRQGSGNFHENIAVAVGDESATRLLGYAEAGQRWIGFCRQYANDTAWASSTLQQKLVLLDVRVDLLSFEKGALLRSWPNSPAAALSSPIPPR